MIVTTFGLNRLDDHASHWAAFLSVLLNQILDHRQALDVLLGIVIFVLLQRVLVPWVAGNGPIECGNIHLVNRLRMRAATM